MQDKNDYILDDGAKIAVIGGGPTGSFFSIFAMKMAKMIDKQIEITVFDPKDFTRCGPAGCNRCGGVISELLVQTLALEGINLPDSIVRKGINAYQLHTEKGSVTIATPSLENTIATVHRGGGPLGLADDRKESFDNFLLAHAIDEGAIHHPAKIDRVEYRNGKPVLFTRNEQVLEADLVVGAFGVNAGGPRFMNEAKEVRAKPRTVKTAIAEIGYDPEVIARHFGNSIHLFLIPLKNVKFAAMIPKGSYVTVCILGKEIDQETVTRFLDHPVVKRALPQSAAYTLHCRCLPKMNVSAPRLAFADRMVMCGDAGSTRLFKDGLGAAYVMGKAAATTAVFQGVSEAHFRKYYLPVYRGIAIDNWFGRYLFAVTDLYKKYGLLTAAMIDVVRQEQQRANGSKVFSTILWNMFTGNERYKNVFRSAMSVPMHLDIWTSMARSLVRRGQP